MEELNSPIYAKSVIEFVTVANEFCKFLETADDFSLKQFVDTAHKVLPFLYLKGAMLPVLEESFDEFNEKFVTEDDYNFIRENLLLKFGEFDVFDEIYDPLRQENDEPVQLRLSEHFADIYQDLKDFLMLYRVGTNEVMANALWECRQAFEQYWGQRIVNSLRVLHNLKYNIVELETGTEEASSSDTSEFDYGKIDTSNWLISRMQEDYDDEE